MSRSGNRQVRAPKETKPRHGASVLVVPKTTTGGPSRFRADSMSVRTSGSACEQIGKGCGSARHDVAQSKERKHASSNEVKRCPHLPRVLHTHSDVFTLYTSLLAAAKTRHKREKGNRECVCCVVTASAKESQKQKKNVNNIFLTFPPNLVCKPRPEFTFK